MSGSRRSSAPSARRSSGVARASRLNCFPKRDRSIRAHMCGIAGILGRGDAVSLQIVGAMTRAIAYRGPDDEGVWLDREAGISFGHRRLAIIDASAAGHTP